jgi:hypothetical protein
VVVVVVGTTVVVVVVVGGAVVVVVVVGGTVVVVVVVVGGTVVVVVVVAGTVVVVVVVGATVVVVVVAGPAVVVVVSHVAVTGRHCGWELVVGPPAPTWVSEMPSVCGTACGVGHETEVSPPSAGMVAVVVMPPRYVVTAESTAGATMCTVTSGVVNVPGDAAGVFRIALVVVVTMPFGLPITPGFAPTPTTVNVVVVGTAWITAPTRLYPAGVLPVMSTTWPAMKPCAAVVVYVSVPPKAVA